MGILVKNRQAAADKEYISLKNKSLENELYYINELYEKNSKNFHDLNNHLSVISLMIENKQYNEIKKYIDTINDKADTSSQNHKKFNTGNIAVDSVLNLKYSQIEKKNIDFDITYNNLKSIETEPSDLGSLLFNLLDNAIEAADKADEPKIDMKISLQGNLIIIAINNTFSETDLKSRTPQNGRGWGIKIIKDTVKKYDGEYSAYNDEKLYKTKVVIKNKKSIDKHN